MKRLLIIVGVFIAVSVGAEVEKTGVPCETGLCLFWWPKLPAIKGWHQELNQSQHYGINALAPDGSTFEDAETVIYAKASYKPRVPETKSLDALIAQDKEDFKKNVPGVTITEAATLTTGDGQKLRSLIFHPQSEGNWERAAYAEEDDYYLVFTVSSRTKSGYEKSLRAFEELIRAYKKKL